MRYSSKPNRWGGGGANRWGGCRTKGTKINRGGGGEGGGGGPGKGDQGGGHN